MKKVQVIWSTEALVDLEMIYDFLEEQSQQAAQNVIEKILSRVRQIETFPESGATQVRLKDTDKEYRYLVEGNYKIIYGITDQQAYIATVFDTRYNPDKLKV
ncbi:MAG TPA: type II toxin-antitoxin system RelE/ParE family toxin [Cyclobacteriaceae bacterium]|nr:type II toxin-antitoxin system RelE/ParE family toxin [Cyclobacteriaceae bacterium]